MKSIFSPLPVLLAACWVSLLLTSISCSTHKPNLPPFLPASNSTISPKLSIDVYLDASTPIAGFLSPNGRGKNHFHDLLYQANGLFTSPWPDAIVRYWRFGGADPQQITSDDGLMSFLLKPGSFSELNTNIDRAIDHTPPVTESRDELKLIITDLFQKNDDVGRLATRLNNAYLKYADKAVAVLAIRNPYKHKIYDLPNHTVLNESAADSLPFYVLICGRLPDVKHAADLINSRLKVDPLTDPMLFALFSSHPISAAEQSLGEPSTSQSNNHNFGTFTTYSNKVDGAQKRGIPYIAAKQGRNLSVFFPNFPGEQVAKTLGNPVFGKLPTVETLLKVWNKQKNGSDASDSTSAFKFDFRAKTVNIDTSQLAPHSTYLAQFNLHPTEGDFEDLAAWNLEVDDLPHIIRDGFEPTNSAGKAGKTLNLKYFLQTMSDKIFPQKDQKDQPSITLATYYLYLEAN